MSLSIKEYENTLLKNNKGTLLEKLNRINLSENIIKEFEILNNVLKQIYKDNYDIIVITKDIFIVKVKLNRVRITRIERDNSIGNYHIIRNLFISYQITIFDNHIYFKSNIGLNRNLFTEVEYSSNYVHSHININPIEVSYEYKILSEHSFNKFCLGESAIEDYIAAINDSFIKKENVEHNLLKFFTYFDLSYLTIESGAGVPYKYINKIAFNKKSTERSKIVDSSLYKNVSNFFSYLSSKDINIPIFWNNDKYNVKKKELTMLMFDYCLEKYKKSNKIEYLINLFCKKENVFEDSTNPEISKNLKDVFYSLANKNSNNKNKIEIITEKINSDTNSKIFFKNEFLDIYIKKVISKEKIKNNSTMINNIKDNLYLNNKLIEVIEFFINTLIKKYE